MKAGGFRPRSQAKNKAGALRLRYPVRDKIEARLRGYEEKSRLATAATRKEGTGPSPTRIAALRRQGPDGRAFTRPYKGKAAIAGRLYCLQLNTYNFAATARPLPFRVYTTPWSSIARATLRKPAMLAPAT